MIDDNLLAERLQAAAILESLSEGVVAVNVVGEIVSVNPAARALLGLGQSGLTGANLFETVRQHELHELVRETLRSGRVTLRECTLFSPRERVLRAQGVPCAAPGPRGARVVLVLQDVTEHHRYDQLRREFVANVSHELKSPLTSIRSLTETLLDGGLEDPSCNQRFVSLIEEDSTRLSRLIDDLLILSQVESRAIPLYLSALELYPVVAAVLAPLEILMREKGLWVNLDIPPGLTVRADPDRLRQILHNLVDNAVKYSPKNGRLEIVARSIDQGNVYVTVSDEGPGIPPEACTRVFERFYRVDKTRSRELGGTGLGLSIVKHIVESHGGRVWVESVVGKGSKFCFTLPVEAQKTAARMEAMAPSEPAADGQTELGRLQERLLVMGGLVEEAVGRAVQALVLRDGRLARQVVEGDQQIDQVEIAVDDLCLRLLAEHSPQPEDLRLIAMAFKIIADLERMGDLAVSIAHRTLDILKEPLLHPLVLIPTMAEQVQAMVKGSLDALVQRDVELALDVCRRDDEVDRLNATVFQSMKRFMTIDPGNVERATSLLLVARALERIADHATNIAENVVYLVRGRTIKHRQSLTEA